MLPAQNCYIIAEIGINHNGSLKIAKELIDMAVETGCNAVKFQKRTVDTVYPQELLEEPRDSPWGTTQRAQKEGLELDKSDYDEIDRYCRGLDIDWFGSAWDLESLEFLASYDTPHHKVASAMVTSHDFLEAVAGYGVHTYISTAMCEWEDINKAVETFTQKDCPFTLMHCVGTYPMRDRDANLNMLERLAERYNCPVGFSSHEIGLACSFAAALLGAVAVERHITLDRAMYGSDQAASLERRGLELLVRDIRLVPEMMGDGSKCITDEEAPIAEKLRYFVG